MKSFTVTIQRCSECSGLVDDRRISAGGIILQEWTDGKTNNSAINVSSHSRCFLVKCPYCLKNIWFNKLEVHSSQSLLFGEPEDFDKSRPFSKPKVQDYADELAAGRVSPDNEENFRLVMWWVGNDRRRDIKKKKPMLDSELENLQTLSKVCEDPNKYQRLKLAEIKRELGLFDEASRLLIESCNNKKTDEYRIFLQGLVSKQDCRVRAIPFT